MKFNNELELDILAKSLSDPSYRERARRSLTRHTFTDDSNSNFWNKISTLPAGDVISDAILETIASNIKDKSKRKDFKKKIKQVCSHTPSSSGTSLKMLEDFVMYQHLSHGIKMAIRHLSAGDLNSAMASMKTSTKAAPSNYDVSDWIEDFEDRQSYRLSMKEDPSLMRSVPTRLRQLDDWLNGGIQAGQLGLIVGTTGRGKSHFSVHIGFWAAVQGYTTLHITTEMSARDVATRYDAKMLGMPSSKIETYEHDEEDLEIISSKYDRIKNRLKGKLRIIATPLRKASISMIENAVDDMTNDGKPVDLLIVDCGDHLQPSNSYRDYRLDQSGNYWDMKSLATELNIPIWSTTQAPKEVVEKIAGAENVADSYDKARIADIIWTLNQTSSERTSSIMRGYLAKNRKGATGKVLHMEVDLSMSHFQETIIDEEHSHEE